MCFAAHLEHLTICKEEKEQIDHYTYIALVWFVVEFTQVQV